MGIFFIVAAETRPGTPKASGFVQLITVRQASVPLRVLIVEGSEDDGDLIVRELRRGGYEVQFERVDTAAAIEAAINSSDWDLIISDFSMPVFSGIDALAQVRKKRPDVPFIFVPGTMGEETAVAAVALPARGRETILLADDPAQEML